MNEQELFEYLKANLMIDAKTNRYDRQWVDIDLKLRNPETQEVVTISTAAFYAG